MRHEYKYLVDERVVDRLRRALDGYCSPDAHGSSYTIDTIYFDTLGLDLYRATIEDAADRFKLRVRTYPSTAGAPVFLEVKRRIGDVIVKSRAQVDVAAWVDVLETGDVLLVEPDQRAAAEAFLARYVHRRGPLVPQVMVRYQREAFTGRIDDYVRITIDRGLEFQPWSELSFATDDARWWPIDDPVAMRAGGSRSLAVLELKFAALAPAWLIRIVRSLELPRLAFSKYTRAIDETLHRPGGRVVLGH